MASSAWLIACACVALQDTTRHCKAKSADDRAPTLLSREIFLRSPSISESICSSCFRNTSPASGSAFVRLLRLSLRCADGIVAARQGEATGAEGSGGGQ
jgi:hypothetical protein